MVFFKRKMEETMVLCSFPCTSRASSKVSFRFWHGTYLVGVSSQRRCNIVNIIPNVFQCKVYNGNHQPDGNL